MIYQRVYPALTGITCGFMVHLAARYIDLTPVCHTLLRIVDARLYLKLLIYIYVLNLICY